MTAYAIVQRVPHATPRLRRDDAARLQSPEAIPPGESDPASLSALEAVDPESLGERLTPLRAALAQATWYLFNPDGWR